MTKETTRIWDPAEHLQSDQDMAAYLEAALEIGEASFLAIALEDIARAKDVSQLAKEKSPGPDGFYRSCDYLEVSNLGDIKVSV